MKKILFLIFLCGFETIYAQDIEVKKFEPMTKDQTAVLSPRKDINGKDCALVLVHTLKTGIEFEGWVVGDVDYKDDAYWVYVANGAKHIKIKHDDYQTKDVIFGDYNIGSLKSGEAYNLYLTDGSRDIINKVYSKGWNIGDFEIPQNVKQILRSAASRGDKKAQVAMAQLTLLKNGDSYQNEPAYHWIEQLLSKGDSSCLDVMPGELMYIYAERQKNKLWRGIDKDAEMKIYTDACQYEIKACLKGYKKAGNALFIDFPKSNGQYIKDVIRCCEDSSKTGNIKAMKCLGIIYEKGIGEKVDLLKAEKWYRLLYEKAPLQCDELCRIYGNGAFPIKDDNITFLYNRANEGNEEALFQLGYMYEEGRNVQQNYEKAQDLYSQCKEHKDAIYRSALLFCKSTEYENAIRKGELLLMSGGPVSMNLICLRDILRYYGAKSGYSFFHVNREEAVIELKDLAKNGHKDAIEFLKVIDN